MENVVFTQLSIPEFRRLIQQELEQFHKASTTKQQRQPNDVPGQAGANYVTKKEAARLISVCPSTIDNHARAEKLKRHYVGKSVRFDRLEVLALMKSNTNHKQNNLPNE